MPSVVTQVNPNAPEAVTVGLRIVCVSANSVKSPEFYSVSGG
jgi:hypothetical protein